MNRYIASFKAVVIFTSLLFIFSSCSKRSGDPRILVFTKTTGYHHESIAAGIDAIGTLGKQNKFLVDTTSDASWFTEDSLKKYAAVVFLSTTGDVLDNYQEAEFERYIQAGGGFVGIHAAADCEYDWGWYGRLVGGYFTSHPGITDTFKNIQPGVFNVVDANHISTKQLPKQWSRTDEFYSFKNLNKDVKVLITIDEKSYNGGKNGDNHPMAWYHDYDGGRAFYTNLGHTTESFSEAPYLNHILGGIKYAIGDNNNLNYSRATTLKVPEENRFNKVRMVNGQFYEPMEMTILPNLDILVAQRRGEIMLYKKGDSVLKQAGFLNVYHKTGNGANAEEGLLGIKIDPNFKTNHYVFIFYSPIDTSVNRLSRFTYTNDKIDLASEKVVLQFYSQREICCHTGGSIAFDKDGLLCVSTGDNSTPFNEANQPFVNNGYAPLDDRPGHEQYDARRSSGNANDLRGKILRIKVKSDGTYDIPEGNLYPKGTAGTRPEIYVQGNRNPFRISIDQKNNFLYWGEVGPDAGKDSFDVRGPRGYDEVNQARKAGFFGWPLFVGNNYAYHKYDYSIGKTDYLFDTAKPINDSRNNTGIKELPPAQPAFIWYPYANSKDFPQAGNGGRNAMAGPVYYTDMYPKETRLPDYFNKKLFIYDWIRGWVKLVTMKPNGDFDKMEPFMGSTKFKSLIDMEVGPDGKLYILEYGNGWFQQNPDAGLSRIEFNPGNRSPKVNSFTLDQTSGSLPFTVQAIAEATDPEKDALHYVWNLGNGITKETTEPTLKYTYDKPGEYTITVSVNDNKGAS
ncbi:MAG: PKD domain-containing protein, partial [Chitinophagia bacterium]|nr:PKD domain-containing protein [Chitinophagia bacterium]